MRQHHLCLLGTLTQALVLKASGRYRLARDTARKNMLDTIYIPLPQSILEMRNAPKGFFEVTSGAFKARGAT